MLTICVQILAYIQAFESLRKALFPFQYLLLFLHVFSKYISVYMDNYEKECGSIITVSDTDRQVVQAWGYDTRTNSWYGFNFSRIKKKSCSSDFLTKKWSHGERESERHLFLICLL